MPHARARTRLRRMEANLVPAMPPTEISRHPPFPTTLICVSCKTDAEVYTVQRELLERSKAVAYAAGSEGRRRGSHLYASRWDASEDAVSEDAASSASLSVPSSNACVRGQCLAYTSAVNATFEERNVGTRRAAERLRNIHIDYAAERPCRLSVQRWRMKSALAID